MLPAKLFAGLAVAFSISTGLALLFSLLSPDVSAHVPSFALGVALVPLFCAVTSVNFAMLYYAGDRIFHARWNRTLSILHFSFSVCFGISGSVVYPISAHYGNRSFAGEAALRWMVIPLLLGILSFVAAYVIFGLNLISAFVQIVRTRFAIH